MVSKYQQQKITKNTTNEAQKNYKWKKKLYHAKRCELSGLRVKIRFENLRKMCELDSLLNGVSHPPPCYGRKLKREDMGGWLSGDVDK